MSVGTQPPLGEACLSDLALDLLIARQETPPAHLETCTRCQTRLEQLQTTHHALRSRVLELKPTKAPKTAWRWPVFAMALASTAAVVIGVWPEQSLDPVVSGEIRAKGSTESSSVRFVVSHAGVVQPAKSGDVFAKGDALRVFVTTQTPHYFLLVGIETDGKASCYFPFGGTQSGEVAAGVEQALPGSLILDDSPNAELFVSVFSAKPLAMQDVVTLVQQGLRKSGAQELDSTSLGIAGDVHLFWVRKAP